MKFFVDNLPVRLTELWGLHKLNSALLQQIVFPYDRIYPGGMT